MFGRTRTVATGNGGIPCNRRSIAVLESLEDRRLLSAVAGANPAALSARDIRFIEMAASDNLLQIELGTLAQTNSASPAVQTVGAAIAADQTAAQASLSSVADNLGVVLTGKLDNADQAIFNRLSKLMGVRFDRSFARVMVAGQNKNLLSSGLESARTGNVSIQGLVDTNIPVLATNLTLAESARAAALAEPLNAAVGTANGTVPGTIEVTPITGTMGGSGNLATGTATGSGATINIAAGTPIGGTTNIAAGTPITAGTGNLAAGTATGSGATVNIAAGIPITTGTGNLAAGTATGSGGTLNIASGTGTPVILTTLGPETGTTIGAGTGITAGAGVEPTITAGATGAINGTTAGAAAGIATSETISGTGTTESATGTGTNPTGTATGPVATSGSTREIGGAGTELTNGL